MTTRIFIGNLSFAMNKTALCELIARQVSIADGRIVSAEVVCDRETGRSRGFAFVELASADDARRVIGDLDGVQVMGRSIRVQPARRSSRSGESSETSRKGGE